MGDMNTVARSEHFEEFVIRQTATGRYRTSTEVMEAALRLLEREEARLDWLRDEITKGEASGDPVPFDLDEFLHEMHAKVKD